MNTQILYKDINGSGLLDVDAPTRKVKVVLNRTEALDHAGDVVAKGAFNKTISELGPKGKQLIKFQVDHSMAATNTVGKWLELYVEGSDFIGVGELSKSRLGEDMLIQYNEGIINQHSIGYSTIKEEQVKASGSTPAHNRLLEVKLWENSIVTHGANPYTGVLSVGKSIHDLDEIEKSNIIKKLLEDGEGFTRILKSGNISDESGHAITFYLKQIQDTLVTLFSTNVTEPVVETVQPILKEEKTTDFYKQLLLTKAKLNSL